MHAIILCSYIHEHTCMHACTHTPCLSLLFPSCWPLSFSHITPFSDVAHWSRLRRFGRTFRPLHESLIHMLVSSECHPDVPRSLHSLSLAFPPLDPGFLVSPLLGKHSSYPVVSADIFFSPNLCLFLTHLTWAELSPSISVYPDLTLLV